MHRQLADYIAAWLKEGVLRGRAQKMSAVQIGRIEWFDGFPENTKPLS